MRGKKAAAVITALIMGVSAGSTGVWAADSYQETEKTVLVEGIKDFAASYGESLGVQMDALKGSDGVLSLKLTDAGRVMIGNLAQMDVSWMKNADMKVKVTIDEGVMAELLDVYLNDQKICSVECYMDAETSDLYLKIPEISDSYIKMNIEDAVEMAEENQEGSEEDYTSSYMDDLDQVQNMVNSMNIALGMEEYLPDAKAIEELLTTYTSILVDNVKEGATGTETVTVGDISQECTVFEGIISEKEILQALQDILTEARDDVNIKDILLKWGETEEDPDEFYAAYQGAVDAILSSVETQTEVNDDDSYFFSKIWVDQDGAVAGRQLGLHHEEGTDDPLITYQMPKDGDKFAMKVEASYDSNGISLTGNGEIKDEMLSGEYVASVNGVEGIKIQVNDYDIKSMSEGELNASYVLSVLPDLAGESYDLLSAYAVTADLKSEGTSGDIALNLLSQGASLGELRLTADVGEGVEIPDFDTLENTCNILDEKEATEYMSTITLDAIMENLSAAGMPEEMLGMLTGDMAGADVSGETEAEIETADGSQ